MLHTEFGCKRWVTLKKRKKKKNKRRGRGKEEDTIFSVLETTVCGRGERVIYFRMYRGDNLEL